MKSVKSNLSSVIFRPYFYLIVGAMILFSLSTFVTIRIGGSEFLMAQLTEQQQLFSDHIAMDLLSGANYEIHRKCQSYFAGHNVVSLQVRSLEGDFICNLQREGSPNDLHLVTPIFFDEVKNHVATTIEATYSSFEATRFVISTFAIILLTLAATLGLQYYLGKKISRIVSRSTAELASLLKRGDITQLTNISRKSIAASTVELDELYVGTESLARKVIEYQSELVRQERNAAIGKLASQVSHDIRSPLTALKVVSGHLAELPEEKRVMIRHAVQRIDDIANDLAGRTLDGASTAHDQSANKLSSVQLLSGLIEPLISEKRIQYRGRLGVQILSALDAASYGLFAMVQAVEFKRVLSNLINNAVEAMGDEGTVAITMTKTAAGICITVQDSGAGIPPEIVVQLMQRGATFGKAGGSGLGLYHARTTVESWGGSIALASVVGQGTTLTLTLPHAAAPDWFVPVLQIPAGSTVVMVDDDASIHQVWQERFEALNAGAQQITLEHYSSGAAVLESCHDPTEKIFLCDYELLGEPGNGLDILEQLGVSAQAVLVTSRYEEPAVRERARALGVRMIPKGLAGCVPIEVVSTGPLVLPAPVLHRPPVQAATGSAVLRVLVIDDDVSLRLVWPLEKGRLGIQHLDLFASMEACEAAQPEYASYDLAFVDKNIEQSAWSLAQTIAHLKTAGVTRVYVASGEALDVLAADPHCAGADGVLSEKVPSVLPG